MVYHATQPDVGGPPSRSPNMLPHLGVVGAGWVTTRVIPSQASEQDQNQHDDEHRADDARWAIA